MGYRKRVFLLFLLLTSLSAHSQVYVRALYPGGENYPDNVFNGLERLYLSREQPPVFFRTDSLAGPAILVDGERLKLKAEEINPFKFYCINDEFRYSLFLRPNIVARSFIIEAEIRKISHKEASLHDVSLLFGFDIGNSCAIPPEQVYYPTILRKEENTMWGSFTTPAGRKIAIACPSPVKQITYLQLDRKNQTVKIDLTDKNDSQSLEYNETRKWAFSLSAVAADDTLKNVIYNIARVAVIDLKQTLYFRNERVCGSVFSRHPVKLTLIHPTGAKEYFNLTPPEEKKDETGSDPQKTPNPSSNKIDFCFANLTDPGIYLLTAETKEGLLTSAGFTVFRSPKEIVRQEIIQALKAPVPQTPAEVCYADLLVIMAGHWFPEYKDISEERFEIIKTIFLQPQIGRLDINTLTTPESGFFLLELALLSGQSDLANPVADYFSRMQLPNGSLFYPKTKEDITASGLLLSAFLRTAEINQKNGNTEAAAAAAGVLRKALEYLKTKQMSYDESLPSKTLITAEQFLEFSASDIRGMTERDREDFFRNGVKLLQSMECHIQKENSSPYFHAAYNTPSYIGVAFPTDPTAVFLNAAAARYEIEGREDYLLSALNALATLMNRSRETEHRTVHTEKSEDSHCRFQATLLMISLLYEKAYIYIESPKKVRGYHCLITEEKENAVTAEITDDTVSQIHVRTSEPVRIILKTPSGTFDRVVTETGWITLN